MAPFALPSIPPSALTHLPSLHQLRPRAPTPSTTSTAPFSDLTSTLTALTKRQTIVAIPTTYKNLTSSPPPGEVAGIVLGSVAGLLLILWLIYTCFNLGGRAPARSIEVDEVVRSRRSHSPRRVRSRSRSEVIEVRSPPRRERRERERSSRRETIVIEESRRREPERERERERSVVREVMSEGGDDIVEVIEEHSPAPPVRRERREREGRRVSSGYRTVDPESFGGGERPRRKVSHRG